jgi:hypothetical protein
VTGEQGSEVGSVKMNWTMLGPVAGCLTLLLGAQAEALPQHARDTRVACGVCHWNPAGGPMLNAAGRAYKAWGEAPLPGQPLAEYVPTATCKECHADRYQCWLGSRHARACASLRAVTKAEREAALVRLETKTACSASASWRADHLRLGRGMSAECLVCHTTGYDLPGGYRSGDCAANAELEGVGCEGCHGPGSDHVNAPAVLKKVLIHRPMNKNTCRQCHEWSRSPDFDFGTYVVQYETCDARGMDR